MADKNLGGEQAWVKIVLALITTAGLIIVALISNRAGQATGGEDARATAAIQQSTSVALAASTQIVVTSPPLVITSAPLVVTSPPIVVTSPPVVVTSPAIVVTSPPSVVTATPEPTPIPPENTPPTTTLEVGQTWKQDGAELTLVNVWFDVGLVNLEWKFTNNTNHQLSVTYGESNFTAQDNIGKKLRIFGLGTVYSYCGQPINKLLNPGDSIKNLDCSVAMQIEENLANTRLTEIIVTAAQ